MLLCAGGGAIALYALAAGVALLLSIDGPRVMLPEASGRLIFFGFLCLVAGTILAMVMPRRLWPLLPVFVLAFVPGALVVAFALILLETVGRPTSELDRIALPDGRVVMLGLDPVPTDVVYSLWLAEGSGWRPALPNSTDITYSEDGSFTADPRLVLAPDGKRLLVRRGGIWTDCFNIGAKLKPCFRPPYNTPRAFRERSAEIEALIWNR